MTTELIEAPKRSRFRITAVTRFKHADLHEAAKKMGGISALAKHINFPPSTVCRWANLQDVPRIEPWGERWTPERIADLESKLFALTGKLLDELFPPEMRRTKGFLRYSKRIETTREVEPAVLGLYSKEARLSVARLVYEPEQFEASANSELAARLEQVINTLHSERSRKIITMRYGLFGTREHTLEETAAHFNLSRERIRQIEIKSIRNLAKPHRAEQLMGFLDEQRPKPDPLPSAEEASEPAGD